MSQILITGASGFIGKALAASLSARHRVLCMSRKNPGGAGTWIRGEFSSFEDLRRLDGETVDAVVHLGAVTGGCLERDGILVNVEGTRVLMRYLIDRGVKKFVNASSIAAVGMQDPAFRPRSLPIPDEHPCLDRDGYGLSKYLMEEVTRYLVRQNPGIDVISLRLSSVSPNEALPGEPKDLGPWALGSVTVMLQSDAVHAFQLAVESPLKPGLRILNACAPKVWSRATTAQLLRRLWGEGIDVSPFLKPGCERNAVYDANAIRRELGFEATATLDSLERALR